MQVFVNKLRMAAKQGTATLIIGIMPTAAQAVLPKSLGVEAAMIEVSELEHARQVRIQWMREMGIPEDEIMANCVGCFDLHEQLEELAAVRENAKGPSRDVLDGLAKNVPPAGWLD